MRIKEDHIGGGYVRRTFTNGSRRMKTGEALSRAEILAMPTAARNALIANGFVEVFPPPPNVPLDQEPPERFVVRNPKFASKTFDVIEGHRIAEGISKEEADVLAAAVDPPAVNPDPKPPEQAN